MHAFAISRSSQGRRHPSWTSFVRISVFLMCSPSSIPFWWLNNGATMMIRITRNQRNLLERNFRLFSPCQCIYAWLLPIAVAAQPYCSTIIQLAIIWRTACSMLVHRWVKWPHFCHRNCITAANWGTVFPRCSRCRHNDNGYTRVASLISFRHTFCIVFASGFGCRRLPHQDVFVCTFMTRTRHKETIKNQSQKWHHRMAMLNIHFHDEKKKYEIRIACITRRPSFFSPWQKGAGQISSRSQWRAHHWWLFKYSIRQNHATYCVILFWAFNFRRSQMLTKHVNRTTKKNIETRENKNEKHFPVVSSTLSALPVRVFLCSVFVSFLWMKRQVEFFPSFLFSILRLFLHVQRTTLAPKIHGPYSILLSETRRNEYETIGVKWQAGERPQPCHCTDERERDEDEKMNRIQVITLTRAERG